MFLSPLVFKRLLVGEVVVEPQQPQRYPRNRHKNTYKQQNLYHFNASSFLGALNFIFY